ncbi:MAG: CoA ester lyase [Pseudomonadota bacterium]
MFRSYLFSPGDSEKKLAKSLESGADCVILDLEDSVAVVNKPKARALVTDFVHNHADDYDRIWVRLNAIESDEFEKDLDALKQAAPMGVVLPKSNSIDSVKVLSDALDSVESASKRSIGATKILAIATETAAGVLNMSSYQSGHPRLAGLTWGAEDLAAALSASSNVDEQGNFFHPFIMARSLCLLAASAAGVPAIEGVATDFRNLEVLRQDTLRARQEGFFGRLAIHPAQVPVINQAFLPTAQEVDWANRVVEVFESGEVGVAKLDGKMVDIPHYAQAQKIIGLAQRFAD